MPKFEKQVDNCNFARPYLFKDFPIAPVDHVGVAKVFRSG